MRLSCVVVSSSSGGSVDSLDATTVGSSFGFSAVFLTFIRTNTPSTRISTAGSPAEPTLTWKLGISIVCGCGRFMRSRMASSSFNDCARGPCIADKVVTLRWREKRAVVQWLLIPHALQSHGQAWCGAGRVHAFSCGFNTSSKQWAGWLLQLPRSSPWQCSCWPVR